MTKSVEPATEEPEGKRGPAGGAPPPLRGPAGAAPPRPHYGPVHELRWWQKLRSGFLLSTIALLLGLATAAAIGIATIALFGLLRGSVD